MFAPYDIEITQKINAIEGLKSQLLMDVAHLYTLMAENKGVSKEKYIDLFTDLVIITYLLSKQMGTDYELLNSEIIKKLKYTLIEDSNKENWAADLKELLTHFSL